MESELNVTRDEYESFRKTMSKQLKESEAEKTKVAQKVSTNNTTK